MEVLAFLSRKDVKWKIPSLADGSVIGKCPKNAEKELLELGDKIVNSGGSFIYEEKKEGIIEFSFWSPAF